MSVSIYPYYSFPACLIELLEVESFEKVKVLHQHWVPLFYMCNTQTGMHTCIHMHTITHTHRLGDQRDLASTPASSFTAAGPEPYICAYSTYKVPVQSLAHSRHLQHGYHLTHQLSVSTSRRNYHPIGSSRETMWSRDQSPTPSSD